MACTETPYAAIEAVLLASHIVSGSRRIQKDPVPATLLSKISKVMGSAEYNSRVYRNAIVKNIFI
jgi:hypothetical protein